MTPQEQQMLQGLADRVNRTQLPEKDVDAEQLIQQTLGRNPDAQYVMAQTILVQGYALEQAQKQIADLSAQLDQARQAAQQPKHATSFLGNLLGHRDEPERVAPPPPPPPPPQYSQAQYVGAPMYAPSGGYPIAGQPQGGGFLRSAMETATGVAAGALAFEGVESLLHGFGHSAGYGTAGFEGLGGGRPEEVINNYYGDASPHEHGDTSVGTAEHEQMFTDHPTDASQFSNTMDSHDGSALHDASYVTSGAGGADDSGVGLNDTSDYSDTDDSITSDDVGGDQGSDQDFGGDDSSGFDSGGDSGGGDDGGGGF
jgi:hypothetical protein